MGDNLQTYILTLRTGANQLHIYYKDIANIKIHIPSPEKQQEILAQIEPKEKLIELLKSNIEQAELEATQIMNTNMRKITRKLKNKIFHI